MGHKLYAPASYWKYDRAIIEEMTNGCGPDGWKAEVIPDRILGVDITETCNIHDFMYIFGATEKDREIADRVFLNNMLRIVEAESRTWATRWLRRKIVLYYYGVCRDLGGTYFWSDKNIEEEFKDPQEVFEL